MMEDKNRLRQMILSHWCLYRPQMVEDLRLSNCLDEAISEAEVRTSDLLYEMLSVRKMPYQEAWEQATRHWTFLPNEIPR